MLRYVIPWNVCTPPPPLPLIPSTAQVWWLNDDIQVGRREVVPPQTGSGNNNEPVATHFFSLDFIKHRMCVRQGTTLPRILLLFDF